MIKRICSTVIGLQQSTRYGFSELEKFKNSFISTTNVAFIESLYEKWNLDKKSVSPSFAAYFELLDQGEDPEKAIERVPTVEGKSMSFTSMPNQAAQQLKIRLMIDSYRTHGHQFAKTDPLQLQKTHDVVGKSDSSILSIESFGFTPSQYQEKISLQNLRDDNSDKTNGPYSIKAMEEYLEKVYCNKVGYEYMHILSKEERDFIKIKVEEQILILEEKKMSKEDQLATFKRLCKDQCFIDFLGNKFGNFKRFGIEGLNSATSALGSLVETAAEHGAQNIVFGMAHRGRLNALHCVFGKPAQSIFREFLEKKDEVHDQGFSGDVKYHMGYVNTIKCGEKSVTLSVLSNPSHLEAVNPLVYGSTKAIQEFKNDKTKDKVFGVLIHGDAAISGQGIVYESLQMQDLVDYSTGGIIHIVLNNQVGFTTNPNQSRSSYHCTEIAKAVDAPVFHVNADEPDMLDWCMKVATAYRYKFKKDIFIDIVGYRRYGHNEQDQPFFTQPKMYKKISEKASVFELYSQKLIHEKVITKEQVENLQRGFTKEYEEDYRKVMSDTHDHFAAQELDVKRIRLHQSGTTKTGVAGDVLRKLFTQTNQWPAQFNMHPTIKKIYEQRIKNFSNNDCLDWATMESLAFASLLNDGYLVRLSGQDVERGTFSHRHAFISDQKRDVQKFCFLKTVNKDNVTITNSHLSQFGVMGFEYGYSITNPNALVVWEAQFGDFANGATTIIDNFLISGQAKWCQQSGLVLNLPHGMDGQGPEHSQGRIQRFLHLSDDNCDVDQTTNYDHQMAHCNIQVVCCSTTSNYFHAMRRQILRHYRKPLIMFNSKKLLKFRGANRPLTDIMEGTQFTPVYADQALGQPADVKTVLLCHGQFYYEMKAKRDSDGRKDIAIIRIEQIAPFPHQHLHKICSIYGLNVKYFWAQEEHENYGPWNFIHQRLEKALSKKVGYFGRPSSASTSVGAMKLHKKEEQILLFEIFG